MPARHFRIETPPRFATYFRVRSFLSKRRASDGLPLPPKRLNFLVTGAEDENWFMEGGLLGKRCVLEALERNGIQLASDSAALDFGCGCGRVLRHFKDFSWRLFGCDWNARLVRWNRRHLPFAQFAQNGLAPPLPYPDQSFHLIYAFSVFTHLSETLQHAWKSELRRVLKPGGTLSSLGVYSEDLTVPLTALHAGLGDHKIITSLCPGGKERMRRLMNVVASERIDLRGLITHRFKLDQIEDAYELFANQRDGVLKIAITP